MTLYELIQPEIRSDIKDLIRAMETNLRDWDHGLDICRRDGLQVPHIISNGWRRDLSCLFDLKLVEISKRTGLF
jgi:hypothetical protein